jgi:hypothetical protein
MIRPQTRPFPYAVPNSPELVPVPAPAPAHVFTGSGAGAGSCLYRFRHQCRSKNPGYAAAVSGDWKPVFPGAIAVRKPVVFRTI